MGLQGQIPTGVATGVSGSLFAAQVVTTIAAAGTYVPAAGNYYAYALGADLVMEVQDSGGIWRAVTAAGVSPNNFETDGTNIRFRSPAGGAISLIKIG